jgi:hypothetical protein
MTKRRRPDRALERLKAEWRESRKKYTLAKAVERCRTRRLAEPRWLREAFRDVGRERVGRIKKTGRKTDLLKDGMIHATVEEYRREGYALVKALKLTSREYYGNWNQAFTVKSAWLRHRKRIVPFKGPFPESWDESEPHWKVKREYLKNDQNAAIWLQDVPSYLKPKKK